MLPFHFHDSQVLYTIDMTGIIAVVSSPTIEDDIVVFNEEEYFNYVVQCLDYGDPLTARETEEELSILGFHPRDFCLDDGCYLPCWCPDKPAQ